MSLRSLYILQLTKPRLKVMIKKKYSSGVASPPKTTLSECGISRINSGLFYYEEAIKTLNRLQSNAASIRQSIINKGNQTTLEDTVKYLNRSGLSLEELDKLSIIHLSGTKGKGSTCALTESILRAHGCRTGFFSSPHLISVTERIRINGEAISKKKFTRAFWKVFNKLDKHKESENDLPAYFKFLTILCFHIFLEENLEVILLEVGIGGEYDCTNIVRNTSTVGITSLGLEHTNILGDTIEDIAWQKAGIIKPNSNVYTNAKQLACLKIIEERTLEKNAKLVKVPDITAYHWPKHIDIANFNKMVQLNGSLAIQLAYSWLRTQKINSPYSLFEHNPSNEVILTVSNQVIEGLNNCVWPGRCQAMDFHNFRIHLDGAHTLESMDVCSDWFQTLTKESDNPRILIFNTTGDRDSKALLKILKNRVNFDLACFVPNIALICNDNHDNSSIYSNQDQLRRAEMHNNFWRELIEHSKSHEDQSQLFETVLNAFLFLKDKFGKRRTDILVTGSLHLLGATIVALEEFKKTFTLDVR